jgi:hypothetical protein
MSFRHWFTLTLLLLLGADDSVRDPTSPAAIAAINKADAAQKNATESFDASMFKIKRAEAESLKAALKAATQKGDLDEANAIDALIKSIEAEFGKTYKPQLKAPSIEGRWKVHAGTQEQMYVVAAHEVQTDMGPVTAITKGDVVTFKYTSGKVAGWSVRMTFVADRVFVEGWPPDKSINNDPAPYVSAGDRDPKGE